jgi:FixJ family two-component response regulator
MTPLSASSCHDSQSWRTSETEKTGAADARPSPSVFLIDDDAAVRRALSRLIKSAGYRLHAFGSAREFLASDCRSQSPACLVLDVRLPDLGGLDLQNDLNKANANLPIVFITGHGNVPMSVRAMKSGAVDFLPKPIQEADLLRAVEQGLARAADESAQREEIDSIQRRIDTLTPREKEVMTLVVKGLLNKQIAFDLGTAEKTIKVHRARVMEKMDVNSLAELVRLAARVGIGQN